MILQRIFSTFFLVKLDETVAGEEVLRRVSATGLVADKSPLLARYLEQLLGTT